MQVTVASMQNIFNLSIQPPIPPKLDFYSMNPSSHTIPRMLPASAGFVDTFKESSSVQHYINGYSSVLTPLYTLDKSFPVCQECHNICTRELDADLSAEKRKLLKQYGVQPVAADSSAMFSLLEVTKI